MKLNTQTLENHWQEIMGKLREKWGSLSEHDLNQAHGDVQQLVKMIQQKTGATREAIQGFLEEIASNYGGTVQKAAETIRGYVGRASESVQQVREQASETVRSGVKQSQDMVRTHPAESLLTCFGIGILTGVVIGLTMRSR